MRPLDIIGKREKCIGTQSYRLISFQPCPLFFPCKYRRFFLEAFLPFTFAKDIFILLPNIYINSVVPIRPAEGIQEFQAEYLRCLAEIPIIRFLPSQPCAVNSRLLPRSDADRPDYIEIYAV